MEIRCPSCGTGNWLENEIKCHICGVILRRCVDCLNYQQASELCRALNVTIDLEEARQPRLLSASTNCREYRPGRLITA